MAEQAALAFKLDGACQERASGRVATRVARAVAAQVVPAAGVIVVDVVLVGVGAAVCPRVNDAGRAAVEVPAYDDVAADVALEIGGGLLVARVAAVLLEPGRVDAPPAWRVVLVGAAVARRVRRKARLNLDVLDRLALRRRAASSSVLISRSEETSAGAAVVVLDCVSSAKRISFDEISYPPPATRLTPGKQSETDLTESVTIMAPAEGAPAAAWPSRLRLLSILIVPAESAPAAAPPGGRPMLTSLSALPRSRRRPRRRAGRACSPACLSRARQRPCRRAGGPWRERSRRASGTGRPCPIRS